MPGEILNVKHFRPYLYDHKCMLVNDHKPIVWFQNSKDSCSRVKRWKLKLGEYDFNVVYKAGSENTDALSRNPVEEPETSASLNIMIREKLDVEDLDLQTNESLPCWKFRTNFGKIPDSEIYPLLIIYVFYAVWWTSWFIWRTQTYFYSLT